MGYLSEDIIKKAGVNFLKSYYRMRDRTGSGKTTASFNVMTEGGIVADGHLSFIAKNGEPFTATLEATSFNTLDELRYRTQGNILAWDSFAIGCLITAFVFSYSYAFNQFTIHKIGLWASCFLLVFIFLGATAFYYFSFRWMQRYRYIYAIEQFKKYHADEQWIAIGENIFEGPEDKYLKELKAQCVYNGFGLISIDKELHAQLLITPSRREVFGKKRAKLTFDERDESMRRGSMVKIKQFGSRIGSKMPKKGSSFFQSKSLGRYRKSHTSQILLSFFSLALLAGIFYKQLDDKPFNYVNEKQYLDSLERLALNTFPESEEVVIDTPWVEPFKKEAGYLDIAVEEVGDEDQETEDQNLEALEAEGWDETSASSPLLDKELIEINAVPPQSKNQIIISTGKGELTTYDCARLYNMRGAYYLVQDNVYSSFEAARKRIKNMSKKGITLHAFSLGCLDPGNTRYVVHFDFFCGTKAEAKKAAASYQRLLSKKGIKKKPAIKSLKFK